MDKEIKKESSMDVGNLLSNVAFNWAQRPGYVLTQDDCNMLDDLSKKWDNAKRLDSNGSSYVVKDIVINDLLGFPKSDMKPAIIVRDKEHLKKLIESEIDRYGNNCDLNHLDVSNVRHMAGIFYGFKFNGDISKWDVSKVIDMSGMFLSSNFNGDISKWNVSNVLMVQAMFSDSKFNGDISNWDTSKVIVMTKMFHGSKFNGDISNWNVSRVESMEDMFIKSLFNKDISNWKPYNLKYMLDMFSESKAPIPYWTKYKNIEERKKAINAYCLHKEFNSKLSENNSSVKKIKI